MSKTVVGNPCRICLSRRYFLYSILAFLAWQTHCTTAPSLHEFLDNAANLQPAVELDSPSAETQEPLWCSAPKWYITNLKFVRQSSERLTAGQRVVVLLHFHKSGGTLLCNLARNNGMRVTNKTRNCLPDLPDKRMVSSDQMCTIVRAAARTLNFIAIEYQSVPDCIMNDPRYMLITVLRPSKPRVLSHWMHDIYEWPYLLKHLSFEGWRRLAASGILPTDISVDNMVVRMLTDTMRDAAGCIGPVHVQSAALALSRFSLVMDTETMDADLACLSRLLGWQSYNFSQSESNSRHSKKVKNATVDHGLLWAMTQHDTKLYDLVKKSRPKKCLFGL